MGATMGAREFYRQCNRYRCPYLEEAECRLLAEAPPQTLARLFALPNCTVKDALVRFVRRYLEGHRGLHDLGGRLEQAILDRFADREERIRSQGASVSLFLEQVSRLTEASFKAGRRSSEPGRCDRCSWHGRRVRTCSLGFIPHPSEAGVVPHTWFLHPEIRPSTDPDRLLPPCNQFVPRPRMKVGPPAADATSPEPPALEERAVSHLLARLERLAIDDFEAASAIRLREIEQRPWGELQAVVPLSRTRLARAIRPRVRELARRLRITPS